MGLENDQFFADDADDADIVGGSEKVQNYADAGMSEGWGGRGQLPPQIFRLCHMPET